MGLRVRREAIEVPDGMSFGAGRRPNALRALGE